MKIAKKTYDKNVRKFAKRADGNWKKLVAFSKNLNLDGKQFGNLCKIVDDYSIMNIDMFQYAYKNDLDIADFFFDAFNATWTNAS